MEVLYCTIPVKAGLTLCCQQGERRAHQVELHVRLSGIGPRLLYHTCVDDVGQCQLPQTYRVSQVLENRTQQYTAAFKRTKSSVFEQGATSQFSNLG